MSFIEGLARGQISLLPPCIDDYIAPDAMVRVVDAFVSSLDLVALGFERAVAAGTGRPGYDPGDMLRLYIWGYLNQVRSSRHLERACVRDLEALWLLGRLAPDYRTIAAFRHDNPAAIISASAAFIQFCREQGLIGGRMVALDGTKMRAVASPKNIAGAERLARDIAHTEKEIAYYLDRLDIIDETVAQGYDDQPLHRDGFKAAITSLQRRRDRLLRRQQELQRRDEKVLVFGEPEAKPMGYGRAPKTPSYNVQSVVDVESGLIVHHDVYNDANDSHLLHPMSVATKEVLEVDELQVLTDGGYSNAEEIARCERDHIEVAAPIKRGAMNSDHFRPAQFIYDEVSDTIRCPAAQTLRPSGVHTRNRAIRYRTTACSGCVLKPRCTPGAQRTIHRLVDQSALDRMEARIHADPHSIVPQPRKTLFLFIKLLTPLHFSRQPYRQKLSLLFSLGNFGCLKIPPIAFNRQGLLLLQHFSPRPSMRRRSSGRKSIPSKFRKYLFLQILLQTAAGMPSPCRTFDTVNCHSHEK